MRDACLIRGLYDIYAPVSVHAESDLWETIIMTIASLEPTLCIT
jgi:hypothetical protein